MGEAWYSTAEVLQEKSCPIEGRMAAEHVKLREHSFSTKKGSPAESQFILVHLADVLSWGIDTKS